MNFIKSAFSHLTRLLVCLMLYEYKVLNLLLLSQPFDLMNISPSLTEYINKNEQDRG